MDIIHLKNLLNRLALLQQESTKIYNALPKNEIGIMHHDMGGNHKAFNNLIGDSVILFKKTYIKKEKIWKKLSY